MVNVTTVLFSFLGMDEGIQTMKKGELGRLYIEPHKGYGSKGFPTFGYPLTAFGIKIKSSGIV